MNIRRILVPTDFSEAAEPALDYAVGLARSFGAELVLFHALEPLVFGEGAVAFGSVMDQLEQAAHAQLQRRVTRLKARGLKVRGMAGNGSTARLISDTAGKLRIDLIVMGTHGRGAFSRMLIGSVAEKVVRTAMCPVLTVRPRKSPTRRAKKRPARRRR
jgi:nucleotide-binding universal stress UspA family protein